MILIVDDDVHMVEHCAMFLESCGYDVRVACSGADALSRIKECQPGLLISDCRMPDLTGLQLSKQLKADPSGYQFPILLMSSSLQCQVASGTTCDGFIRKPFLAENLLNAVQKLINGKAASVARTARVSA